jgi:hypothetical protein
MASSPTSNHLAAASVFISEDLTFYDSRIEIFDRSTGRRKRRILAKFSACSTLALSPCGLRLVGTFRRLESWCLVLWVFEPSSEDGLKVGNWDSIQLFLLRICVTARCMHYTFFKKLKICPFSLVP